MGTNHQLSPGQLLRVVVVCAVLLASELVFVVRAHCQEFTLGQGGGAVSNAPLGTADDSSREQEAGTSDVAQGHRPDSNSSLKVALAHYVAMSTADAIQTTRCVQANRCTEQNPALAPMVSHTATFLAVRAGVTTAAVVGLWKVRTAHPTLAKWLAVSLAAGQTVIVASNYRQMQGRR